MIKLTFCLKRLPHLSRQQFLAYWLGMHGPLVKNHASALNLRRYVQQHTLDDPLNEALRDLRGAPEAFDGVAELWWDTVEDLQEAMESPAGQVAALELLEDEKTFIDLSKSPLWIAQERPVIGD